MPRAHRVRLLPVMRARPVHEDDPRLLVHRANNAVLVREAEGVETLQIADQPLATAGVGGDGGGENFPQLLPRLERELVDALGGFPGEPDL